jgi:hypothetical protein
MNIGIFEIWLNFNSYGNPKMKNEKYTYKDWLIGTVYLETCSTVAPKGSNLGIKTDFTHFSKEDAIKIKRKQKELFELQKDQILKGFINTFKKLFKNSDAKESYLEREFSDVNKIFSHDSGLSPRFYNWNTTISREDLSEMRKYVDEQIIKGEKRYDFMHSPKFVFQSKNKIIPEIYAQVCWDYFKWLNNFVTSLNKKYSKTDVSVPKIKEKPKEKLGVPLIALVHFYNNVPINRDNSKEIAAKYGYNSKTSGEGLFHDYSKFSKNAYRLGINDESRRQNETKRNFLIKVVTLLKGNAKKHAEKDLATFNEKIQDRFN